MLIPLLSAMGFQKACLGPVSRSALRFSRPVSQINFYCRSMCSAFRLLAATFLAGAIGEVEGEIGGDAGGECGETRKEVGDRSMASLEMLIGSDSISSDRAFLNGSMSEVPYTETFESVLSRDTPQVCCCCIVMAKGEVSTRLLAMFIFTIVLASCVYVASNQRTGR